MWRMHDAVPIGQGRTVGGNIRYENGRTVGTGGRAPEQPSAHEWCKSHVETKVAHDFLPARRMSNRHIAYLLPSAGHWTVRLRVFASLVMGFPSARRSARSVPGSFLRARSVLSRCAYSISPRIACLRRWRARFRSDAVHAAAAASSPSFAFDTFWTSLARKESRSGSAVTRASSAMSRQSIDANVGAAGSPSQSLTTVVVVVVVATLSVVVATLV